MRPPLTKELVYQTRRALGPCASVGQVAAHLGYFRASLTWLLDPTYVRAWRAQVRKERYYVQLIRLVEQIRAKRFALGRTPRQRELVLDKKLLQRAEGMYYLSLLANVKPLAVGNHRNPKYDGRAYRPPYWNRLCAHFGIKSTSRSKPRRKATG